MTEPTQVLTRVQVNDDHVEISLDPARLMTRHDGKNASDECTHPILLKVDAKLRRSGTGKRMVLSNGNDTSNPDPSLCRLMARAHAIRERLQTDPSLSLKEIARQEEVVPSYVTRLLRLSFLAPDIITVILKGDQPAEPSASRLVQWKDLPLDWQEQRRTLGFS